MHIISKKDNFMKNDPVTLSFNVSSKYMQEYRKDFNYLKNMLIEPS